ncbi:hypothetical protein PSACC_00107 [Paramicrosporidium saccamoebae]|uniref:Uncharacterized protein n=1 Tax=Paramicrosporidium saccamoebae TaxID=1246581 RepID=A0A2H9TQN9_9FUNG|nr:hypothetical protein PSACC_00107 [Paramicrosporidium saccamoebae]
MAHNGDDNREPFPMGLWTKDLTGVDFGSINLSEFLGPDDIPKVSHSVGTVLGKHDHDDYSEAASREVLIDNHHAYVQAELASVHLRLTRLEEAVTTLSRERSTQDDLGVELNQREISRGHLDRFCLPVLEATPEPTVISFNRVAQQLNNIYLRLDRKSILSQVRKWFRKRREEMGGRIASSVKRHFSQSLKDTDSIRELIDLVERDECDLSVIINDARLEITNNVEAKLFTKQKILSFLARYKPAELDG